MARDLRAAVAAFKAAVDVAAAATASSSVDPLVPVASFSGTRGLGDGRSEVSSNHDIVTTLPLGSPPDEESIASPLDGSPADQGSIGRRTEHIEGTVSTSATEELYIKSGLRDNSVVLRDHRSDSDGPVYTQEAVLSALSTSETSALLRLYEGYRCLLACVLVRSLVVEVAAAAEEDDEESHGGQRERRMLDEGQEMMDEDAALLAAL